LNVSTTSLWTCKG